MKGTHGDDAISKWELTSNYRDVNERGTTRRRDETRRDVTVSRKSRLQRTGGGLLILPEWRVGSRCFGERLETRIEKGDTLVEARCFQGSELTVQVNLVSDRFSRSPLPRCTTGHLQIRIGNGIYIVIRSMLALCSLHDADPKVE